MANLPAVFLIALPCALIEDAERQSITIFTVTENDAKALWSFPPTDATETEVERV